MSTSSHFAGQPQPAFRPVQYSSAIPPKTTPSVTIFNPDSTETVLNWGISPSEIPVLRDRTRSPVPSEMVNQAILDSIRDSESLEWPKIDTAASEYFRSRGTLGEFYASILTPWREKMLASRKVKFDSVAKERQSVRDFAQFDLLARPDHWDDREPWRGRPIRLLTEQYFESWILFRLKFGRDNGPLSPGTMEGLRNQLRTVIGWTLKLKIIDRPVKIPLTRAVAAFQEMNDAPPTCSIPTTFTELQLQAVYERIADVELKSAWALGSFFGPRSSDLFNLRWEWFHLDQSVPDLIFVPRKTQGRRIAIWVPVPTIVMDHLKRLIAYQVHDSTPKGLLFPSLTDANRSNASKGQRAELRNRRIRKAIADAGIAIDADDLEKPWQMLRRTAESRLDEIKSPMGDRAVHGRPQTLTGTFYNDYRDSMIEAMTELDRRRRSASMFALP